MTGIIKGINAATIMHGGRVLAVALKTIDQQGQEDIFYMQHAIIRDVMMIMQNKLRTVAKNLNNKSESYKASLRAENQLLMNNLPHMRQEDLQNPDSNKRIMSVALKEDAETFTVIAALLSGHVAIIRFANSQADFALKAISLALQNSGDKESIIHICGALDFIPLCDTSFSGVANNLDYQQYPHEAWRLELFPHHVAILFRYQTSEGDKILKGVVVKTYITADSAEIQNIGARVAHLMPHFRAMQEIHQIKQIFCKDISAEKNLPLTIEQCLYPLRNFYLEMKNK